MQKLVECNKENLEKHPTNGRKNYQRWLEVCIHHQKTM